MTRRCQRCYDLHFNRHTSNVCANRDLSGSVPSLGASGTKVHEYEVLVVSRALSVWNTAASSDIHYFPGIIDAMAITTVAMVITTVAQAMTIPIRRASCAALACIMNGRLAQATPGSPGAIANSLYFRPQERRFISAPLYCFSSFPFAAPLSALEQTRATFA